MKTKKACAIIKKSVHMLTNIHNCKTAFTLAEVLITLGIIGVVATMTLPSVINKYKKQETVTRLKKAYSIVNQMLKRAEADFGDILNWEIPSTGHEFFETYIKDYIQYSKEYSSEELWSLAPRLLLNGNNYTGTTYKSSSDTTAHFSLADGSIVSLNNHANNSIIWVGIDINGLLKPNQVGKDTFLFIFSTKYGLQPLGGNGTGTDWSYGEYSRDTITGSSTNACNKNKTGYWCTALIIQDGWKIKDDYPW